MSEIPAGIRAQVAYRSGGRCEAAIVANDPAPHRCKGKADVIHHKQRRNVGGHALDNLLHLCDGCHRFCHSHPEWAREQGFIVSSYEHRHVFVPKPSCAWLYCDCGELAHAPECLGGKWCGCGLDAELKLREAAS